MSHIYDDIVIHDVWELNNSDLSDAVWKQIVDIRPVKLHLRPVGLAIPFPDTRLIIPLQFCTLGLAYFYALPSFLTILDKRYNRLRQLLDHIALKICEDYRPIVGRAVWGEIIFHDDDESLGAYATMMAIIETNLCLEEKAWGFIVAYMLYVTDWRKSPFSFREFNELNDIICDYVFGLRVFTPDRWLEFEPEDEDISGEKNGSGTE